MSRALWLLLWFQLSGWFRYLGRNLRTLRGALLALVGLAVFVPWLVAVLAGAPASSGVEQRGMEQYGPAMLLLYCVLNVLFSSHERAIYFTPAEVQFLFTGPFSRRQVLSYKMVLTILVSVPATVIMAAVLRVREGWAPAVLLGLLLISMFMQLFSMALGLLGNALGETLYGRGRKLAVGLLLVAAAMIVAQGRGRDANWDWRVVADEAFRTPAWRAVSWPLRSFFNVMLADQLWPDLVAPLLVALAVLFALVGLIFALDAHYLEAAAAASARTYAKIQRMRGRAVSLDQEPTTPTKAPYELPMPPYLGGVGPVFWRQMTTAVRGMGRVLWVLFIVGAALAVPLLSSGLRQSEALPPMLIGVGVWMSVFLTTLVPFDFRGDIDRLATLKTLPVAPWRLALGQLLTPALLLALMLWMALGITLAISPEHWQVVLATAAYVPAFSFFLVGVENLLFLLFPVRVMAATPGDFQALGRNVLLGLGKLMAVALVAATTGLTGLLVYAVTGRVELGVAAGFPIVLGAGLLLVPLVALAFTWFDVGRDTPA